MIDEGSASSRLQKNILSHGADEALAVRLRACQFTMKTAGNLKLVKESNEQSVCRFTEAECLTHSPATLKVRVPPSAV